MKGFGVAWSLVAKLELSNLGLDFLFVITDKATQVGHHDFWNTNKATPTHSESQISREYEKRCVASCRLVCC